MTSNTSTARPDGQVGAGKPFEQHRVSDSADNAVPPRLEPISVEQITVRTGRLVCDVTIENPAYRTTTPALAAWIVERFPDVPHHACVNGEGRTFAAAMEHTPVPHMLEHVAISLQTRITSCGDVTFAGTTTWTDERAGQARIELGFCDDLEALRAFTEATAILNDAVIACLA